MKFTPGPGLGGGPDAGLGIPIDPLYLSWKLRSLNYTARFIELASEINTGKPRFVVAKVQDALNDQGMPLKGSKVLVLGAAYKPEVDDGAREQRWHESPALDVIGLLRQKGAEVSYNDPYLPSLKHDGWALRGVWDYLKAARAADCVVVITDHTVYNYKALAEAAQLVVDTPSALAGLVPANGSVVKL